MVKEGKWKKKKDGRRGEVREEKWGSGRSIGRRVEVALERWGSGRRMMIILY